MFIVFHVEENSFAYDMLRTHSHPRIEKQCYNFYDWNTKVPKISFIFYMIHLLLDVLLTKNNIDINILILRFIQSY